MGKVLSREEREKIFINRAKEIHGDLYDYSEIGYIDANKKVKIYCNTCKEFFYQYPMNHLGGHGCAKCAQKRVADKQRHSLKDFIKKAQAVHGNTYDYSQVNYVKMREKVKIGCPYCGNFFYQTPIAHVRGQDCPCQKGAKTLEKQGLGLEEFVRRAQNTHGNLYDYSQVEYKGAKRKVKIFCTRCGTYFWQKPERHMRGNGCPNCAVYMSKEEFITKAKAVHGDKYDYSETNVYTNEKIKIYCKNCNRFFYQSKNAHLQGKNCNLCSKNHRYTQEEFIEKVKKIHGNKYDFSETFYKKAEEKVKVFCNECKKYFYTTPSALLQGRGCQKCASTIITWEEFLKRSIEKHENKYEYIKPEKFRVQNKIKIYCKSCKKFFIQNAHSHMSGKGCIVCSGTAQYTTEEFIAKSKELFGKNTFDYNNCVYTGMLHKIKLKCNKCNLEFEIYPVNHIHQKHGCPNCKPKSKGEEALKIYLKEKGIKYIMQKKFKNCKAKRLLPFDFYLPDYNTCIEYQGIQHYKSVERFGGDKAFMDLLERDQIKRDFCKKEGIKLIEIKYNQIIEDTLDKIF